MTGQNYIKNLAKINCIIMILTINTNVDPYWDISIKRDVRVFKNTAR
jgi:hypothetical protein